MHLLRASVFFVLGFVAQLFFLLTGVFVCMLPKIKDTGASVEFTQGNGYWFPVHLPSWARLWDNNADGARGDKRGWFWNEYERVQGFPDFLKYYWWLAFRNPANNFKRYVLGFDIRTADIETIYGQAYVRDDFNSTGFQLVKAGQRYHLYIVYRYGKSNNALVIELGNKFQVRHNKVRYEREHKYFKGFTTEVNFYKDIS